MKNIQIVLDKHFFKKNGKSLKNVPYHHCKNIQAANTTYLQQTFLLSHCQ
jgi:hypothetical protein